MPILPLAPAVLLYYLCRRSMGPMSAFIHAAVLWGVLALALTELLSLGHLVTRTGLALGWGIASLPVAVGCWRVRHAAPVSTSSAMAWPVWARFSALSILLGTLVTALVAPPNSTDALTYHLARVAQWMQHQSVHAYATSVTRQIFMPAWAEYVILHLQVLAGGSDRLANLVEWCAFAACLVASGGVARRLGADARGVGLAVVLTATIPTAVIEASSAQTDLVVTFWMVALAWIALGDRSGLRDSALAGAALGLALASKGTAYVFCAPLVALLVLRRLEGEGVRAAMLHAGAVVAIALLIMLPTYTRNIRVFQHPLGPAVARADLGNASHGLGPLASNVMRNATVHLRSPMPSWNRRLARAVERTHAAVGLDVQDPRTTYPGERFSVPLISTYEGRMGNPLQFLLVGVAAMLLLLRPAQTLQRQYGVAVLAGALLFCWLFRWQHWHGRLHTPFFVLAAPLTGMLLSRYAVGWWGAALALLLWVGALPWLVANQMRPLVSLAQTSLTYASPSIFTVPRERQYLEEEVSAVYLRVVGDLAREDCADLVLAGGEETRAYPLVPFARARGLDLRLSYVFVKNETVVLEERPRACALFAAEEQPADWRPGAPYDSLERRWRTGRFALWQAPRPHHQPRALTGDSTRAELSPRRAGNTPP